MNQLNIFYLFLNVYPLLSNEPESCDFYTFRHSYTGQTRVLRNPEPSVGIMKSKRSREPKTKLKEEEEKTENVGNFGYFRLYSLSYSRKMKIKAFARV